MGGPSRATARREKVIFEKQQAPRLDIYAARAIRRYSSSEAAGSRTHRV